MATQTKAAFTPGPWKLSERYDVYAELDAGYTPIIASCVEGRFSSPPSVALSREVVEANARLLAAAPDLLEACKQTLALQRDPDGSYTYVLDSTAVDLLEAAIAKATAD